MNFRNNWSSRVIFKKNLNFMRRKFELSNKYSTRYHNSILFADTSANRSVVCSSKPASSFPSRSARPQIRSTKTRCTSGSDAGPSPVHRTFETEALPKLGVGNLALLSLLNLSHRPEPEPSTLKLRCNKLW